MKYVLTAMVMAILMFTVACSDNVNNVVNEQINSSSELETYEISESTTNVEILTKSDNSSVDIDLGSMTSEMIYSNVYQMMINPSYYEGKTIRMIGNYSPSYYEDIKKQFHYCVIQDATACCSQGIEFVWDDGSHIYPDEYPAENAEIEVVGTFETYNEKDGNTYCRLKNSSMTVLN